MSTFIIETDTLSTVGESIFNSSQELLELSETVASYATDSEQFDFTSAKNKIAENINKMQIKMSNMAQVMSFAAELHTEVQSSIKCQASEGLDIKTGTSSPAKPTPSPEKPTGTSAPTTSAPTTPVPTSPDEPTNTNPKQPTETPSPTEPAPTIPSTPVPTTAPTEDPQQFINYYIGDYNEKLTNNTSIITTTGASTAVAMVLTAINKKEITPVETTEWGIDNKADIPNEQGEITYFDNIAKTYEVECETMELTKENILKNISDGKYMIISMDEGKFGNKGNYIVITGITEDGKIKIADPNSQENSEMTWDLSVFLEEGLKLWGFSKPVENKS